MDTNNDEVKNSGFSFDTFMKITGGNLRVAYNLMKKYIPVDFQKAQMFRLHKPCPVCGTAMVPTPFKNADGVAKVRWTCTAGKKSGDTDKICGYEEFQLGTIKDMAEMHGTVIEFQDFATPFVDLQQNIKEVETQLKQEEQETQKQSNNAINKGLSTLIDKNARVRVYDNLAMFHETAMSHLPEKLRRPCPTCGHGMLFYRIGDNDQGWTGAFVCPQGWEEEDPALWCGYHELSTMTARELMMEYFLRGRERHTAAQEAAMPRCPSCGSLLRIRAVEDNKMGWKSRLFCKKGSLLGESEEDICGYELLQKESVEEFINKLNTPR